MSSSNLKKQVVSLALIIAMIFSMLPAFSVYASDRYYNVNYNPVTDAFDFIAKADHSNYAYIRGGFNGWSDHEDYKLTRDPSDTERNGLLTLSVPASHFESFTGNQREFKLGIFYDDNNQWMSADGGNGSNSVLPDRDLRLSIYVATEYIPETSSEPDKVKFTVKAHSADYGYVMSAGNDYSVTHPDNETKYKFERDPSDSTKTGNMEVVINYDDLLASDGRSNGFKVYLFYPNSVTLWADKDGADHTPNSELPERPAPPVIPNGGDVIKSVIMDEKNKVSLFLKDDYKAINFEYTAKYMGDSFEVSGIRDNQDDRKIILDVSGIYANNELDPRENIEIGVRNSGHFEKVRYRNVLDEFKYSGDLGYKIDGSDILVNLWAPTADKVELLIYDSYTTDSFETDKLSPTITQEMTYFNDTGRYAASVGLDNIGKFYLFRLTFDGEEKYAVDPYAYSVGINGLMGAFVNMDSQETKSNAFASSQRPALVNPEDSIIYEMHVRDFTISPKWNGNESHRGKYLGVVEAGTTATGTPSGSAQAITVKTGLDHLVELGITHVHLLPTYDFVSTSEHLPDGYDATSPYETATQRNWGYDPLNYNAPEGSYSTNPADPNIRIFEYREMVAGLHNAGIRVVKDVVYNHMASMDNLNNIVDGYYFRQWDDGTFSNDSGCGNAVETTRAMVSKFIVDSCVHWVREYKLDGLRFDLMAIIDTDTMSNVKSAVQSIDPSIIVYGEPWMADSSPLPESLRTTKNKGVAFFNDTYRDALRGNNNPSKGYVQGILTENIGNVLRGLKAEDVTDPEMVINYVEAHDNYAIWDQIEKSENTSLEQAQGSYRQGIPFDALSDWRVKKAVLANAFVLLSQGIPFYQGGSEIIRTKQGDHNSYKSNDAVNDFDWNDKIEYKEVFDYYKGLIEIRKNQDLLRLTTKSEINSKLTVNKLNYKDGLIYYHLKDGKPNQWKEIVVIFNATNENQNITWLPFVSDTVKVAADSETVSPNAPLRTYTRVAGNFDFEVVANSLMILYSEDEPVVSNIHWDYLFADQSIDYMDPLEPSASENVTVRFRAKAGDVSTAELLVYEEGANAPQVINMSEVDASFYTTRGYDQTEVSFFEAEIPASASKKYYHFKVTNNKNPLSPKVAYISAGRNENGKGVGNAQGLTGFSIHPDYKTSKWARESVFYQIFVERFRDGDVSNNKSKFDFAGNGNAPEISAWNTPVYSGNESDRIWNNQFFGGDLVGVREALPYIQNVLGANAIYLMPVFESDSDHKYDGGNYEKVDSGYGGNQSLKELGNNIRANSMNYVLDGVFNHSSSTGQLFNTRRELFFTGSWTDETGAEFDHFPWHGKYFNFAKLDYSKDETRDYIYRSSDSIAKKYLQAPYFASGWRLDAAEDVNTQPRDFKLNGVESNEQKAANLAIWQEFTNSVRSVNPDAYILGEFWGDNNQWYVGKAWDGKMNYAGFYLPFIENNSKNPYLGRQSLDNKGASSVADIAKFTREQISGFPYSSILGSTNSISTHDKPRFLNVEFAGSGNTAMMQLAQVLQTTVPGIPMIYYGDEIGMVGKNNGADPYNRGTFNWDSSEWNLDMLNNYRRLLDSRKKHNNAFVYGAFEEIISSHDEKFLVYTRYAGNDRVFVVLNNNGAGTIRPITITDIERFGLKDGDVYVDVLTGTEITVSGGSLKINSKDMSGMVLVKKAGFTLLDAVTTNSNVLSVLNDYSDTRTSTEMPSNVKVTKVENGKFKFEVTGSPNSDVMMRVFDEEIKTQLKVFVAEINANGKVELEAEGLPSKFKVAVKTMAESENHMDSSYLETSYAEPNAGSGSSNSSGSSGENSGGSGSNSDNNDTDNDSSANQSKDKENTNKAEINITTGAVIFPKEGAEIDSKTLENLVNDLKNSGEENLKLVIDGTLVQIPLDLIDKNLSLSVNVGSITQKGLDGEAKTIEIKAKNNDGGEVQSGNSDNIVISMDSDGSKLSAFIYLDGELEEIPLSYFDSKSKKIYLTAKLNQNIIIGTKTSDAGKVYKDIKGHYAQEAINFLSDRGLMVGVASDRFDPNMPVTRGMIVAILGRMSQQDENTLDASGKYTFMDIPSNAYYQKYIGWAADRGIILGVSELSYLPDYALTREQAFTIIQRFLKSLGMNLETSSTVSYKDAYQISTYAHEGVKALTNLGIVKGYQGMVRPKDKITRGEMSVLIHEIIKIYMKAATN